MTWLNRQDPSGWPIRMWDWGADSSALDVTMRNSTVADGLWRKAREQTDDVAIWFDDGSLLTFGQAANEVMALAVSLQRLGLNSGDRVSVQLPNWREFVTINLACCALGLVMNPIIPIYRNAEVEFILGDAGSRVVIIPEQYRDQNYLVMLSGIRERLPELEHVIVVRHQSSRAKLMADNVLIYDNLLEDGRGKSTELPNIDPNNVKLVMYTSGTTGNPKGVLHSHNTIARAVDNIFDFRQLTRGDVQFMASPVTHITGYSAIEQPFISDVKAAVMERWDRVKAVDFILKTKSTMSVGATPFLYELVQECVNRGIGVPSLRYFACGGAAVPPELIRGAHKVFDNCRCFRVFGSTEVPLVSQGLSELACEALAAETDGRVHNYDIKIVDAHGNEVPSGEEGEILVRGPAMMLGYTNLDNTREAFSSDGYFLTGDLGRISNDADLVITGRKKDLIIRGGENISAKEIEDVLHTHPLIQEAAVVSMPHRRLGETIAAYLRVKDRSATLTVMEVSQFIHAAGLARQKAPEYVELIDDFPRTASGKIRKDILRLQVREHLKENVGSA